MTMSNTEQQIEKEIQDKGLNAPRLTPEIIDSKIVGVEYILTRDVCKRDNGVEIFDAPLPLQTLTFCILTLENGFTVTGESACASPENFDAEIGKKIAYENAREKIWMLEGYLLKQHLYSYSIAPNESDIKAEEPSESPVHSASVVPFQPNHKHDLAYLLLEILKSNPVSGLRTKIESKLSKLLDELV